MVGLYVHFVRPIFIPVTFGPSHRIEVHAEGKKDSRYRTRSETFDVSAEGYYERVVLPMFPAVAVSLGVTRKMILFIRRKVHRNICNKIIPDTL
jgi:hypothetical protein